MEQSLLLMLSVALNARTRTAARVANAFARKGILRNLGKRSRVANLDRRLGLRARRHHQEYRTEDRHSQLGGTTGAVAESAYSCSDYAWLADRCGGVVRK